MFDRWKASFMSDRETTDSTCPNEQGEKRGGRCLPPLPLCTPLEDLAARCQIAGDNCAKHAVPLLFFFKTTPIMMRRVCKLSQLRN